MNQIKPYLKSLVAALIAGLTALGTALTDEAVTPAEWTVVAVAFLSALGVVYAVPNKGREAKHARDPNLRA